MSIEQKDTGYFSLEKTNNLEVNSGFPVANRLRLLQKLLKIKSINAFAAEIGVDASVLNNIMSPYGRKGKPSFDTLEKIACTFTRVNIEWLITGRGEPLRPFETIEKPDNNTNSRPGITTGLYASPTNAATDYAGAISELSCLLKVCQAEKESLEKVLTLKDDLIKLLKELK